MKEIWHFPSGGVRVVLCEAYDAYYITHYRQKINCEKCLVLLDWEEENGNLVVVDFAPEQQFFFLNGPPTPLEKKRG